MDNRSFTERYIDHLKTVLNNIHHDLLDAQTKVTMMIEMIDARDLKIQQLEKQLEDQKLSPDPF